MSAQPTAVIRHTAGDAFLRGRRLVFALPALAGSLGAASLLALLDGAPWPADQDADAELRRRLNAHALALALPGAAPVLDRAGPGDPACAELLDVLTVLAKSSAHVYLRDKEPNLSAIRRDRRVVLLLPPDGSSS
jgi:hypothetical protein